MICLQASLFLLTVVQWISASHNNSLKTRKLERPCPFFVNPFYNKCNFPEVSQQTSHRSHWSELCHMTIPKPIPGKWNGIIIIPLDQSSFLHGAGEGPSLPRKHLAAWHLEKIRLLLAKEVWLLCTQPWWQQRNLMAVLSYLWSFHR